MWLILFLLAFSPAAAEVVGFDSRVIEHVFKEGNSALMLLLGDELAESDQFGAFVRFEMGKGGLQEVAAVARRDDGTGLFEHIVDHIGTDEEDTPQVFYINQKGEKFRLDRDKAGITIQSIAEFYQQARGGELPLFIKTQSEPDAGSPSVEAGRVKVLVGATFDQFVLQSQKQVLVKFYAPWCGHCKTMAADYQQAAFLLRSNPNILLAEVDSSANQIPSVRISGYPTLKFWRRDKSLPPIEYTGRRTAAEMVAFIRRNSEGWVDAEQLEQL